MTLLVRNAVLNGYLDLARSLGVDHLPLLRRVGLHPADLVVHNQWIAVDTVAELLHLSAAAASVEAFGLRLAENRRLSNLGPISLAAREEPDVRSALSMISRYEHLHSEALHIRVFELDGLATVKVDLDLSADTEGRQLIEQTVGTVVRIVRTLVGVHWKPVTVCFTHMPPTDLTIHHRVLGYAIRFGADFNGLVLYSAELDAPNTLSDPLFRPFAQQYIEAIAPARSADELDRIRNLIEALLPTGRCSLQQVAHTLGIDRKTVHRHLAKSNETFSSILNSVRIKLARQYVGRQSRSLTEVAQLLGFSELSAFSRWFRREFGTSPKAWRAIRPDA